MDIVNPVRRSFFSRKIPFFVLAFCCISALLLGMRYSFEHKELSASLMRTIISTRVSIVALVSLNLLPLLLSAICAKTRFHNFIYVIFTLDSFLLGYAAYSVLLAYGSAAWIIRFFLFGSDGIQSVLLFWLWISNIAENRSAFKKYYLIYICVIVAISLADIFLFFPFLQTLI